MIEWRRGPEDRLTKRDTIMWLNGLVLGLGTGVCIGIILKMIF